MQNYSFIKQHAHFIQDTFPLDRFTYTDTHTLPLSHIPEQYRFKYQQFQESVNNHQSFIEFIDIIQHVRNKEHVNIRFESIIIIYLD